MIFIYAWTLTSHSHMFYLHLIFAHLIAMVWAPHINIGAPFLLWPPYPWYTGKTHSQAHGKDHTLLSPRDEGLLVFFQSPLLTPFGYQPEMSSQPTLAKFQRLSLLDKKQYWWPPHQTAHKITWGDIKALATQAMEMSPSGDHSPDTILTHVCYYNC